MSEKRKKAYEKKILLERKATKHRLAEEAKANAQARAWGSDGAQRKTSSQSKRSSVEYRKHPFHKSTWGKYPHISISKRASNDGALSVGKVHTEATLRSLNKKMYEIKQKVQQKKSESFDRIDQERSVGNVSIRKVLATLFQKNTDSLYYRADTISLPWIIKQIARASLVWEVIMYITIVTTFILTSFSAFFSFYEKALWDWISIADFIFAADTILRLSVEIWRYRTRATVVVFTAPYTMLQFLFDLCSMIPLHQIYYWIEGSSELGDLSMIDYFRLNRFFRLSRCKQFFDVLERERRADETLLFCFKFANYYLGFTYFTSCLFVSCIGVQPMDYLLYNNLEKLEESFLKGFQQNKAGYGSTPWDIFVITTNFATAVITTVGYGDVVPQNEWEMTISIVCMLVGAIFLNGYYTSEMTNFRLELDGARFDLYYRLNQIREYLTTIKTLPFFNAKVEEYYHYLWTYREGVFDVPFMRKFPRTFHEELLLDICLEMFDKSQLFYNLDAAFLRAISKTVTVALYNSNMILCRTGSYSGRMFYILQGECQAMSKLNPANASAVIRAGSIIGEANLLFSFPYTTTVETRTCCQFIMLTKQDLLEVMELFPTEMEILRSRSLEKVNDLYYAHQAYGVDPVCWVKAKTDMENPSNPNAEKLRRSMRWGTGFNREVLEDVVDDSEEVVIFNTPCEDRSVEKNHLIPYISCAIPEILNTKIEWIKAWNYMITIMACYVGFFAPYCVVFSESPNKLEYYVCKIEFVSNYFTSVIFLLDVFVEILGACPVAGLYYKFWDGLRVVLHKPSFYLDVLAAIPLDLWTPESQDVLHVLGTAFKILKLWKVVRFFHNFDNVYPLKIFWLRLLQTIICLLYGIHFIACISYFVACPQDRITHKIKCKQMSWLASYEIRFKMNQDPNEKIPVDIKKNTLGYGAPYMYSFFYAAATFTSAGFGDFNPQNRLEMIYAIGFQLFGFFLVGYFTAILTSALSCLVRSKLALQQQLVSLYQFMNHYHLREHLKDRIIEHFVLQHQLRGGVTLQGNTHLMYDAPDYLRNDVLYLEVYELLDGISVFSKVDADIIIKLSSSIKLFLIPPNTTFMHMGEVRRILYVIRNGSMGIFEPGGDQPTAVLEASSHFGIRDLLFGEPSHYIIRSLSYVALYEIKRQEFEDSLQYEEDFWELVRSEKQRTKHVILEMTRLYAAMGRKIVDNDKATSIPSWIEVPARLPPTTKQVLRQVEKSKIAKVNLLNDEFDSLYENAKVLKVLKYFLLRKTIHPVGYFSKIWNCVMSLVCCLTVLCLTLETFCYIRIPWFRVFQMFLDCINYIDIYLKLHWSYYNPHNQMLITHPLKTAIHYALHGSLIMDVAICAPVELLMWIGGFTSFLGYGPGASWYTKLRWIRLFQAKRIPIIFKIVHNIFKHRSILLLTLYVIITLFVCTMVSTVALFIACPWEANDWAEGDQYRIPMCTGDGWVGFKYEEVDSNPEVISGLVRRWILGLYYVSQVILVIGFGDMIILDRADVYLLTFMSIFGFILMRCMTADMTAAEVDSDQARSEFVEHIMVLDLILKREKVHKKLHSSVMTHLHNTWNRSRGLQPRELFSELHPVLESELYGNLVEEKLLKVPIFHTFPPTVLRSIFRYMKTEYVNRGHRIMRFGNLEYEMYIIISGKIYITDQHLNYICSLGPGESFGETSMIYGMARRHNAIAVCSSELYVLSSHHFETFLGRYPNFKNEMKLNLSSEKHDYFETNVEKKMEAAMRLTADQKHKMLATFAERTNHIKEMLAQKEDPQQSGIDITTTNYKRRNIFVGSGYLDENLPFLYFATRFKRNKFWSYPVIHPNCRAVKIFSTLVAWMCFITPAIATYEVCFSSDFLSSERSEDTNDFRVSRVLHKIANCIEVTFLLHCILQFFLAFEVKNGVYNKNPRSIIMRYLTSFDGLIFDIITAIPYLLEKTMDVLQLEFSDFSGNVEDLFENLYLLRIIRLYHYFRFIHSQRDDLTVSTFRLQITLSVTSFCLMAHMLACLFYWISPCTRPDLTNGAVKFPNLCPAPTEGLDRSGWTTQFVIDKDIPTDKEKVQAWRWWFRSLYWVVTTISTTGFGDIVPQTISEMAVGVICMFCGSFILSIILSQFSSGMASLTRTKREYMYQVNLLVVCVISLILRKIPDFLITNCDLFSIFSQFKKKHLKNIGLSEIRQTQVMMYFRTFWESCRGVPYHKSWRKLPLTMQIEVAYALFGKTLLKVPHFRDNKAKIFIRQLSIRVTHSLYIPGSYIHKDGDPGTSMYVVYKGLVSGTLMMANNEPDLKAIYNPGDAFGRFAALFHDGVYKKSYRAETMVEILEVKQRDILHLARKFPQFKKLIYNFILTKYQPFGTNVNIFDKQRRKGAFFGLRTENLFKQAAAGLPRKAANAFEQDADRRKQKKKIKNKKQKMVEEYVKHQRIKEGHPEEVNKDRNILYPLTDVKNDKQIPVEVNHEDTRNEVIDPTQSAEEKKRGQEGQLSLEKIEQLPEQQEEELLNQQIQNEKARRRQMEKWQRKQEEKDWLRREKEGDRRQEQEMHEKEGEEERRPQKKEIRQREKEDMRQKEKDAMLEQEMEEKPGQDNEDKLLQEFTENAESLEKARRKQEKEDRRRQKADELRRQEDEGMLEQGMEEMPQEYLEDKHRKQMKSNAEKLAQEKKARSQQEKEDRRRRKEEERHREEDGMLEQGMEEMPREYTEDQLQEFTENAETLEKARRKQEKEYRRRQKEDVLRRQEDEGMLEQGMEEMPQEYLEDKHRKQMKSNAENLAQEKKARSQQEKDERHRQKEEERQRGENGMLEQGMEEMPREYIEDKARKKIKETAKEREQEEKARRQQEKEDRRQQEKEDRRQQKEEERRREEEEKEEKRRQEKERRREEKRQELEENLQKEKFRQEIAEEQQQEQENRRLERERRHEEKQEKRQQEDDRGRQELEEQFRREFEEKLRRDIAEMHEQERERYREEEEEKRLQENRLRQAEEVNRQLERDRRRQEKEDKRQQEADQRREEKERRRQEKEEKRQLEDDQQREENEKRRREKEEKRQLEHDRHQEEKERRRQEKEEKRQLEHDRYREEKEQRHQLKEYRHREEEEKRRQEKEEKRQQKREGKLQEKQGSYEQNEEEEGTSDEYRIRERRPSLDKVRRHSDDKDRRHSDDKDRRHSDDKDRRHSDDKDRRHSDDKDRRHSDDKDRRHSDDKDRRRRHSDDRDRRHSKDRDRRHSKDRDRRHSKDKDRRHSDDKERHHSKDKEKRRSSEERERRHREDKEKRRSDEKERRKRSN